MQRADHSHRCRRPRGDLKARGWSGSWPRGQDGQLAEVRPGRGRLIGQVTVQSLEPRVGQVEGRNPVVGIPLNGVGDVRRLRAGKQEDRDEPRAAVVDPFVDRVVDEVPFPVHAEALTWLLQPHEAAAVGLGADHQDELGLIEVLLHPAGPALRRRGVDVAVEDHVDPAIAEGVGQGEDAVGMLVGVVAVAEKHPRGIRHQCRSPWPEGPIPPSLRTGKPDHVRGDPRRDRPTPF